ncbi:hypothetical protein AYI69_g3063 [Smittium culicis]|uniref:Uncharacterized protein n=1 Tax=Smittium culicis TaxID=133412 RepID=A0A1R1YKR8_9FUNG|nr:hypothetical protein AYI69_g3063 [Smittium culicis]
MAQLQVRIHSLKVNPAVFFLDYSVHRPPLDDRQAISSFPVEYRDYSLTVYILSAKIFDPPGTPGHPGSHPGLLRCLDEGELKIACQDPGVYWANTGGSLEFTDNRPIHIPLSIHSIAQVGVLVGRDNFLAMLGHISSQLPAIIITSNLEAFTAISQVSEHTVMAFSAACKSADDSANSTASSANSSLGIREVSPGTRTPRMFLNISLM